MRYPDEPHQIIGGVAIHVGAFEMLLDLRATGHIVALDDDGSLTVEPIDDLHENTRHCLDALEEDLVILLSLGGPKLH